MSAQEIKKNMTQGEWAVNSDRSACIDAKDERMNITISQTCYDCNLSTDDIMSIGNANAIAITTAVNNTYGKGIDPTQVGEAIFLLTRIVQNYEIKDYKHAVEKLLTEINIL